MRRRTIPRFLLTGSVDLTILRKTAGEWVRGRWVEGEVEPVVIEANVQPAKMSELVMLPEPERTKQWLRVFSAEEIRTLREGEDGWPADEVVWEGDTWRVMRVQAYKMGVLDHYEALAVRNPRTPN